MTLHLKDRVMEQKLNELSNGEFSKILNESDMTNPNCICFTIDKKEDIELSVYLRPEAIEPEYDPNAWNEYPKVMPPEYVWMRLASCPVGPVAGHVCAKIKNGKWFLDDGTVENFGDYPARVRPWED